MNPDEDARRTEQDRIWRRLYPFASGDVFPLCSRNDYLPACSASSAYPKAEKNAATSPRVDLIETTRELIIVAELPGFDQTKVDLRFSSNSLIIFAGAGSSGDEEGGENSAFMRLIRLPVPVRVEEADAVFGDGVLTVSVPKASRNKGSLQFNHRPHLAFLN